MRRRRSVLNTPLDSPAAYKTRKLPSTRIRVALVESLPFEAIAVTDLLEKNGYDVVHQSIGDAFLGMLAHETFDMLLLDWSLHDFSGYDVLRRVREELRLKVPVRMTTARGGELGVVQALNLLKSFEKRRCKLFAARALLQGHAFSGPIETNAVGTGRDVFTGTCHYRSKMTPLK